jgi:hypothetical protein
MGRSRPGRLDTVADNFPWLRGRPLTVWTRRRPWSLARAWWREPSAHWRTSGRAACRHSTDHLVRDRDVRPCRCFRSVIRPRCRHGGGRLLVVADLKDGNPGQGLSVVDPAGLLCPAGREDDSLGRARELLTRLFEHGRTTLNRSRKLSIMALAARHGGMSRRRAIMVEYIIRFVLCLFWARANPCRSGTGPSRGADPAHSCGWMTRMRSPGAWRVRGSPSVSSGESCSESAHRVYSADRLRYHLYRGGC